MAAPEPDCRFGNSGGGIKRREKYAFGDVYSAGELSEPAGPAPTILDVLLMLQGAHRQGSGFLGFLSTIDPVPLRTACRELRDVVAEFSWASGNRVPGSLRLWRACFPCATAIDINRRKDLGDKDFLYLRGIGKLDMSDCDQNGITDAAFAHLSGIHTLSM